MGRVGRPRSVNAPPCPECEGNERVTSHGFQTVNGEPRRSFRCAPCGRVFVPGVTSDGPSAELRWAVRRVRRETDAPYRLIANAITRHLGLSVSHTTVGAWCREPSGEGESEEEAPCEYLSVLWALRHELRAEAGAQAGD
jgi:transposase-like protein